MNPLTSRRTTTTVRALLVFEGNPLSTTHNRRFAGAINPLSLALLVLVVLLGTTGGAVAGALITGKQIKDGTITGADIATGTITGADVRTAGITGADIADEARMWAAVENDAYGFTNATTAVARSVTTGKGFLQINATIDAGDDAEIAGVDDLLFALFVDDKRVDIVHALDLTSGSSANGALTTVVPVAAGAHKVELYAVNAAELGDFDFVLYGAELSMVWTAAGSTNATLVAPGRHARLAR